MVDIPADSSTGSTISVGETVNGTIEVGGDHDWFRITLTAGQRIAVTLDGAMPVMLEDSYLRIRDQYGYVVAENDDRSFVDLDSAMVFEASYTGTYYIDVAAWDDNGQYLYTGDYSLAVQAYTPPPLGSIDQFATQLVSGYWEGESHHFAVSQGGSISVNLTGLTGDGLFLARQALSLWSGIIGVSFNEVSAAAQISFDDDEEGAFSNAEWSSGITSSASVNVDAAWLADYGATLDSYAFQTYVHEIGHALGLGHAGHYNETATYAFDALYENDAWPMSIMSYFAQDESLYYASRGFGFSFAGTPMLADTVAMSQLYGLSTTTRSGNTTYGFNSTAGHAVYDASQFTNLTYTVFDSGGTDTLDYSGTFASQLIDLNAEAFSNVLGRTGNVAIARGTVIENAIGGGGDDTFVGNAANNVFNGGSGQDTVSYERATSGAWVDLNIATAQNTVGAGTDALISIERIRGSAFNDTLTSAPGTWELRAGTGNDTLISAGLGEHRLLGEAGDDIFVPGVGNDYMNGGGGFDTIDYSGASGSISVYVGQTWWNTGSSGLDGFVDVDRIIGSSFDDDLEGFEVGGLQLWGGAGNDRLRGLGNHQLSGGEGNDRYTVRRTLSSIDAAFENAGEGIDTVDAYVDWTLGANFENLNLLQLIYDPYAGAGIPPPPQPSNFNGTGNELANIIIGNGHANLLQGLGGADTLVGGLGADTLTGGAGADIFRDTMQGLNGDTITDFRVADRIIFTDAYAPTFTYSLSGHTLTFTGGSLYLTAVPAGIIASSAGSDGGVQLWVEHAFVRNDFNGDGRSDILWRNEDGTVANWLATVSGGFEYNAAAGLFGADNDWRVAGTGDFNGDGRDDVLWRNEDGTVTNWLATVSGGFEYNAAAGLFGADNDWHVQPADIWS